MATEKVQLLPDLCFYAIHIGMVSIFISQVIASSIHLLDRVLGKFVDDTTRQDLASLREEFKPQIAIGVLRPDKIGITRYREIVVVIVCSIIRQFPELRSVHCTTT